MKEINFEGDLKKYIDNSNPHFKEKVVALLEGCDYSVWWLIIQLMMIFSSSGSFQLLAISVNIYFILFNSLFCYDYNIQLKKNESNQQLKKLIESLKGENVIVDPESFQRAVELKKEVFKSISNQREIVRYFALLDKEEQIQILKYVRTQFYGFSGDNVVNDQLFLLEEEDMKDVSIPFRRVYKKCK